MQPVALRDIQDPPPPARGEVRDQLHRRYFAEAGAAAARYGVTFARLIEFLASTPQEHACRQGVRYLDDLLHAIACMDDDGRAWADLQERYDQFLIRRCEHRGGMIEAALAVGRLFVEVRRHTVLDDSDSYFSLQGYAGEAPLRSWLADRLGRIQAASPHAAVMISGEARSANRRDEPTIRVRTTRVNLAQPIVPVGTSPFRGTAPRLIPRSVWPSGSFRIGPAERPTG